MAERLHITAAEREIMEVLWRAGPLTPARLIETVQMRRNWVAPTIKTLLGRLKQRRAVRSERDDGRLVYRPLIDRETFVAAEVQSLIDELFEGDPRKLEAFLADR